MLTQAVLYIAPDGNDRYPGSADAPLATLTGARDAVRRLKGVTHDGITVYLRGGEYRLTESFYLTAEDAGTAASPITYAAYPGETVRITGGQAIGGFTPVTDPAVLARLAPEARAHVVQCDLPAQGITDFGKFRSRGFSRKVAPSHLQLFFHGQAMTPARWPNEGFLTIAAIPEDAGENDGHGQTIGALEAGFHYDGDRPAGWQHSDDIWVHGYWAWDWANSYERVASIDTELRLIRTRAPHGLYGFRAGQRFYFMNILEELDTPGEYYLDSETGILYFWPPAPITDGDVSVSLLETPLIMLKDVSHVTLQGLTLEYARGSGISITGGESITVDGCALRNLGNIGVLVNGGQQHRIINCILHDLGDGGIRLVGGDRAPLTPGGHQAVNNHIYRVAQWSRCYQPAIYVDGVGQYVAHNLIHDHPHTAILWGGNEHLFEFNEAFHVCLETGDVGAFYMGRDWTQRGNIVRYNFIHDLGGVGMGSMGVYLDDCTSGTVIYGNIFARCSRAAFIGGGRDNVVENNIFVDCTPAVWLDGRGLDPAPVWHDMVYKTMKGRLDTMRSYGPLYDARYPDLATLNQYYTVDTGVPPENNRVCRNICVGGTWVAADWHPVAEYLVLEDNLVGGDPGFVDAEHDDYQLRDDAAAFKVGFERIPVEEMGLRRDT